MSVLLGYFATSAGHLIVLTTARSINCDCGSYGLPVELGVPQGSVVGPISFLIYMNDMVTLDSSVHFTLHADDTSIPISNGSDVLLE